MPDIDTLIQRWQTGDQRERLTHSWAATFRREVFERLDERAFASLYSDVASRPNVPVNVLVGLETLKAGFDWSDAEMIDAEMIDAFTFNLQVRYALGYDNLGAGEFDLRTVYHFRHRLSAHQQATGQNLLDQAFGQITVEQIAAFELKTSRLRMDSTQIASNIREMSRLQLLVEIAQRVQRMLSEADQARYAERFAPYLRGTSGQFIYHLKGQTTAPHLQHLGELFQTLLIELQPIYAEHETYQLLARVFREQFTVSAAAQPSKPNPVAEVIEPSGAVQPKPGTALRPDNVQSPDDLDATYRTKGGVGYSGYVANVTETCDADNPFQLIVDVRTASNTTDDTELLCDALPTVLERTAVDTLHADSGFGGPTVDAALRPHAIAQIQTAFRGIASDPAHVTLADFELTPATADQPERFTCPHGQVADLEPGRKPERFVARFKCPPDCPVLAQCPTQSRQRKARRTLHFDQAARDLAQRRRTARAARAEPGNPRAAVESTVAALKRPFNNDQLPVRGRFRVNHLIVGSALMVNLRRIHRYVSEKIPKARPTISSTTNQAPAPTLANSFFAAIPTLRSRLCWRRAFVG